MENLKKEYENFGFFKMENAVDKILINKIINEINSVKKNVDIYYDRKDNLRRIERLYDKGEGLKAANKNQTMGNNHITKDALIIAQLIVTNLFSLFIVYSFLLCTSF